MPFCPKCRDEFEDWVEECPDCRVRLVNILPEPSPEPEVRYVTEPLVTVATFSYPLEAHLHRAKLEAEGIDGFVSDEHMINANWLYSIAVGGAKLQVRESDAEKAREILDNIPKHIPEEAEISSEIDDEDRCPECHSIDIHYETFHVRRTFILWFLLFFIFSHLAFPFLKRKWKCNSCGYEWKEAKKLKQRVK